MNDCPSFLFKQKKKSQGYMYVVSFDNTSMKYVTI